MLFQSYKSKIALLAAGLVFGSSLLTSYGSSLQSEQSLLSQLQQESSTTYKQISQEKAKANSLQASIHQYNVSLTNVQNAIATDTAQIKSLNQQIQQLEQRIQQNQVALNKDKAELTAQLQTTYEDGHVTYLAVLLQSTSWDDLLSRIEALASISRAQQQLVQQVAALQHQVEQQKQQLDTQASTLNKKNEELQILKSSDEIMLHQQHQTLDKLQYEMKSKQSQQRLIESQIHLTQGQIQQIQLETEQAQALMKSRAYVQYTTQTLSTASASQVIQYAEQFLGVPYVWGGTTPSGFDCSGFTQYVMNHFNVGLYRTSEEQFAQGLPVAYNNLQPGDLVFFSTYAPGASHVGIYIGNGLMIDAEDMGVAIDSISNSYWGPKYLGARRVFK
ncbi:NlpC/P60 family protein [Alicyclobacillus tolerans]|uniref:C40 family peptidase n=1 Tax=Alicyclobacillus tolerans TaxID=90970 RepID=UPI001F429363|nr:C40 family peptidase [Alicyclobacillus tolerans]MCF8564115.1 NlpC/P60 family protein [Alicyclobacillus tolerans]